jgi:hypothetical protein
MRHLALTLAIGAALGTASPARAESPLLGSAQLKVTGYRPNIDAEFNGSATPYRDVFGTGRGYRYELTVSKSLYIGWGSLDLGIGAGYFSRTGKGLFASGSSAGQPSADDTTLNVVPFTLTLQYRFDRYVTAFPLVPYLRGTLERDWWWVTNGGGTTKGEGSTDGWSAGLGLAFLLDFIDPTLARELDRDTGINHVYLFFEGSQGKVNDFGSRKSWDLSNDKATSWSAGLLFVY